MRSEAASAFRDNPDMQIVDLHGTIKSVENAVLNNRVCKEARMCDVAFTHFVDSRAQIPRQSLGVLEGRVLTTDALDSMRTNLNMLNKSQYREIDLASTYYTKMLAGGQVTRLGIRAQSGADDEE
jgi:hypothetical protein